MPTDPAVVIRRYADADAQDLRQCLVDEQDALRVLDPRVLEGRAMVDAYFLQTMDACRECDGVIFVAELQGHTVGFVTLLKCIPNAGADEIPGPYAAVMDLAVRADWQGHGLGAALLQRAEAEARESGVSELRLNVLSNNRRAIDLYHRLGYSQYAVTLTKTLARGASVD